MLVDLNQLPSEIKSLQKIISVLNENNELLATNNIELTTKNSELITKTIELTTEIYNLKEKLALLKARRFGKSSEKLDKKINEIELKLEENETLLGFKSSNNDFNLTSESPIKNKPKRQKLPDHLPRESIILDADPKCPSCGGEEFRKISDDISETLEHIPSSFKVIKHIRPRCACINCEQIVQAEAPSKAIDKGKAGSGLLSHVLVQKYCNHLPCYRQSQIYAREGVEIARSTLSCWIGSSARLLEPVAKAIKSYIIAADQIHGDDTPVKVLAPGNGKTKIGRIWTYCRDGRPYGDKSAIAACYYYSPDRKGIRPVEHLKDFTGILHADCYAGYDQLYKSKDNPDATITESACFAHMRRKFYEITVANDKANIAITVLEKIAEIYQVESEIRGLDPNQRLKIRQARSKDLVKELFTGFRKAYSKLPKKSSTACAIYYALNHEEALKKFLDNGQIEIDNNAAERAMRSIAIGRKNWLFAGSDNGGRTAAIIYTLIETAKLNNINPWKYLYKLLDVIQDYKINKIDDLLPWNLQLE